jgi:hypothetical protein
MSTDIGRPLAAERVTRLNRWAVQHAAHRRHLTSRPTSSRSRQIRRPSSAATPTDGHGRWARPEMACGRASLRLWSRRHHLCPMRQGHAPDNCRHIEIQLSLTNVFSGHWWVGWIALRARAQRKQRNGRNDISAHGFLYNRGFSTGSRSVALTKTMFSAVVAQPDPARN